MVTPAGRKRLLGSAAQRASQRGGVQPSRPTGHSTQVSQDGSRIIGEDSEVPAVPAEHITHAYSQGPPAQTGSFKSYSL